MFQVAGGSVGLALTTTIFTTASHDEIQQELSAFGDVDAVERVLAGTESARGLPERVIELVRDAFAAGMQWSFRVVALLALGGLLVSVLFVGRGQAAKGEG